MRKTAHFKASSGADNEFRDAAERAYIMRPKALRKRETDGRRAVRYSLMWAIRSQSTLIQTYIYVGYFIYLCTDDDACKLHFRVSREDTCTQCTPRKLSVSGLCVYVVLPPTSIKLNTLHSSRRLINARQLHCASACYRVKLKYPSLYLIKYTQKLLYFTFVCSISTRCSARVKYYFTWLSSIY